MCRRVPGYRPRTLQHTVVLSTAPRQNNSNQLQTVTDTMKDNPTAERSSAHRHTHTNTKPTRKSPRKPRPLHVMALLISRITCILRIGGTEPRSPPANHTKQTTYITNTTINAAEHGGVERCSWPGARTLTTVWSPAPLPWHHLGCTTTNSSQKSHTKNWANTQG